MHFLKLTGMVAALMGASGVYADVWANFCNDNSCGGGCGEGVDVTNPGCLGETGRNSIQFSDDSGGNQWALKWFSDGGCADLVQCKNYFVPENGGCVDLNGNPFASSFQFYPNC